MKKLRILLLTIMGCVFFIMLTLAGKVFADTGYFDQQCRRCHGNVNTVDETCVGCHSMLGTLSASTDKPSYRPGENVTVTVTSNGQGGGWARVILYNEAGVELKRITGPKHKGWKGEPTFPNGMALIAPAPSTSGTYTWTVAWYGNTGSRKAVEFSNQTWEADPNLRGHGMVKVSTNSFVVANSTQ